MRILPNPVRLRLVDDPWNKDHLQDLAFGNWLRVRREVMNKSIGDLAKETGIPVQRLVEIELAHGSKGITARECRMLAGAFGLSFEAVRARALDEVH